MNKQSYQSSVEQEIADAISRLTPHGGGATITETRLRAALDVLAKRIANHTRAYELLGIRTADELAEEWGVTGRQVRAVIAAAHERFGVGRKVGSQWLLSADEAERYRIRPAPGRPRKAK